MLKDEAFYFVRLGTFLERADNTARLIDVKYHGLGDEPAGVRGPSGPRKAVDHPPDFYHWAAVLRPVSAFETYRKVYRDVITPSRAAELADPARRHASFTGKLFKRSVDQSRDGSATAGPTKRSGAQVAARRAALRTH